MRCMINKKNIFLAIDDNSDNLIILEAILGEDFPQSKIYTATNGKTGIKIANTIKPDIILLDIIMPEMDGYEVCKRLKANEKTRHIPIMILTAIKTDAKSRVKALNLGADAFLTKPINHIELKAQLNVLLRMKVAEQKLRSEKKQLEEQVQIRTAELKESKKKYESLFNNSPLPYHSLNSYGYFVSVNQTWLETLGYKKSEVIGKYYGTFLHKDSLTTFNNNFEKLKTNNHINDVEFLIRHKDGHYLDILLKSIIEYNKDGSVHQIYCVFQDLTENKKAEQKLKESQEMFRQIYNSSPDISVSLNPHDNTILLCNDKLLEKTGYKRKEIIGKSVFELYHKDCLPDVLTARDQYLEKGYIENKDLILQKKDGGIIYVSLNVTTIRNASGEEMYNIASWRDITERKQAESVIQELNTSLEIKVAERTKQLLKANENLAKTKAQAEQANKAKSTFLANMSHEIRTPMNAVLGYADIMSKLIKDKTQIEYLNSIILGGKTLMTLINDILDLSKVEAGKLELFYSYVNTVNFFKEFENVFSFKTAEKGLNFIIKLDPDLPEAIYIDEVRLRQILYNLVSNALKFTREGYIKIHVYKQKSNSNTNPDTSAKKRTDLIIEIEDTGIGISKDFQNKIFDSFTQELDNKQNKGTGLGLAITKSLVKLMQGNIKLKSEKNKGSTFKITFRGLSYLEDYKSLKLDQSIDISNITFKHSKILVVDDMPQNRQYIKDALANTNIEVSEAEDGEQAFRKAVSIIPDLIITDIHMPETDGYSFSEKISNTQILRDIPVIAYTADVMKENKKRILDNNFVGILTKPVSMVNLYKKLMCYLPYDTKSSPSYLKKSNKDILLKNVTNVDLLIYSLENDLYSTWKKLEQRQPISSVIKFGEQIIALGKTHNAQMLINYGTELKDSAKNFNIELLLNLLKKYNDILLKIKKHKNLSSN
ncbi:response regulator [Labilibacter sediminis]|nr:response regulator [Labilibacter sediminis]